jgi:hypothetical protein
VSVETAAVAVGKAVGKHVVMAWLADRSAEEERDKDLVELVQARFPDRIMRRRFERQIADIADQVAERLLTLCGHEYGGLRQNDKAAVLAEVVRTLAEADFSDRALFAADVDAARRAPGSTTSCSTSVATAWCVSSSSCRSSAREHPPRCWADCRESRIRYRWS